MKPMSKMKQFGGQQLHLAWTFLATLVPPAYHHLCLLVVVAFCEASCVHGSDQDNRRHPHLLKSFHQIAVASQRCSSTCSFYDSYFHYPQFLRQILLFDCCKQKETFVKKS